LESLNVQVRTLGDGEVEAFLLCQREADADSGVGGQG
jgi:hypothetical protein